MYLVAGGYDSLSYLSSTEILTEGESAWKVVGSLPSLIGGLKGVSWKNTIIMTGVILSLIFQNIRCARIGGFNYMDEDLDSVLSFNISDQSWSRVGQMRMKRSEHAVSLVNVVGVADFCLLNYV